MFDLDMEPNYTRNMPYGYSQEACLLAVCNKFTIFC